MSNNPAPQPTTTITPSQLATALLSAGLPNPSPHFLQSLLTTPRNTTTPLPALLATAKHRLLSSDFTSTPSPLAPTTPRFPPDISSPHTISRVLSGQNIPVQVLDVQDLGRSRWEQLEAMEAAERGETTRGWEVIRVEPVAEGDDQADGTGAGVGNRATSHGPHKLLLQDVEGRRVYALELRSVEGVGVGMSIGTKMVLSEVLVARGMVLLEPRTVRVLGGRIEAAHRSWVENRRAELLAGIEQAMAG